MPPASAASSGCRPRSSGPGCSRICCSSARTYACRICSARDLLARAEQRHEARDVAPAAVRPHGDEHGLEAEPRADPARALEERRVAAEERQPHLVLALRRRRLVGEHREQPHLAPTLDEVRPDLLRRHHDRAEATAQPAHPAIGARARHRLVRARPAARRSVATHRAAAIPSCSDARSRAAPCGRRRARRARRGRPRSASAARIRRETSVRRARSRPPAARATRRSRAPAGRARLRSPAAGTRPARRRPSRAASPSTRSNHAAAPHSAYSSGSGRRDRRLSIGARQGAGRRTPTEGQEDWCRRRDSNPRPIAYEAIALPTELLRREGRAVYGLGPRS